MRVPVWGLDHRFYDANVTSRGKIAVMDYTDVWTTQSKVCFNDRSSENAEVVRRATGRLQNLRDLTADYNVKDAHQNAFFSMLLNSEAPNLRSLNLLFPLHEPCIEHLANVLKRHCNLKQLQIYVDCREASNLSAFDALFDAVSNLPLTALSFSYTGINASHIADLLCTTLQAIPSLVSLQLRCQDVGFLRKLSKRLICPALTEVSLELPPATSDAGKEFSHDLLMLLKQTTRLDFIELTARCLDLTGVLQLVDDGWLRRYRILGHDLPDSFVFAVKRNATRHCACARTARSLIAIRKSKRALTKIAFEVVVVIARNLWETRNQKEWDKEEEEEEKEEREDDENNNRKE